MHILTFKGEDLEPEDGRARWLLIGIDSVSPVPVSTTSSPLPPSASLSPSPPPPLPSPSPTISLSSSPRTLSHDHQRHQCCVYNFDKRKIRVGNGKAFITSKLSATHQNFAQKSKMPVKIIFVIKVIICV